MNELPNLTQQRYPATAHVDLDAIRTNVHVLRRYAPNSLQMAILKADAYGHGLVPVALAALHAGADWLGVAQLTEACELRKALDQRSIARQKSPIFAWITTPEDRWEDAINADIDLSVSWTWTLAHICQAARVTGKKARIHVKIDTGMSRAGSTLNDLPALASAIRMAQDQGLVEIVGAWSHLSRGDDLSVEGQASTAAHIREFERGLNILKESGIQPKIRHLAATSGIVWHPETHYDMVRAGIGLYGLSPDPTVANAAELSLRPAMTLSAPLTAVKVIDDNRPVSYGGTWQSTGRRWLGLVPVGYADGIPRAASNQGPVSVNGNEQVMRTHVVGRICMDQFVIDLGPAEGNEGTPSARSGHAPARVGDEVILFGTGEAGEPLADDWARTSGTINYEIVTRLGPRVPRIYSGLSESEDNL